eukprot:TRINITY_DN72658_c0_g1_i1.p1 TRINITY_DN72658_c0_g1~~TRINITY_DN72658_c0_g1_i1.p1  ORF type:complete len:1378 (+),score=257.53 TRINITY_DN72658_c0_g1_i1:451-4134(+)
MRHNEKELEEVVPDVKNNENDDGAASHAMKKHISLTLDDDDIIMVFQPGKLGLKMDDNLVVTQVGFQAEEAGVRPGWRMLQVDDEAGNAEVLKKRVQGVKPYKITFFVPPEETPGSRRSNSFGSLSPKSPQTQGGPPFQRSSPPLSYESQGSSLTLKSADGSPDPLPSSNSPMADEVSESLLSQGGASDPLWSFKSPMADGASDPLRPATSQVADDASEHMRSQRVSPISSMPDGASDALRSLESPVADGESDPALRELLLKPQFVFQCCDADRDGYLNSQELPFALHAMGLHSECADALDKLEHRCPLDELQFASLVSLMQRDPLHECELEIPHSLRGVSLGQLQTIDRVYITSGWLKEQCQDYNDSNPETTSPQEENLYALDHHVVRPLTKPGPSPARFHAGQEFPDAPHEFSLAQLLNRRGCFIHFFVSHCWADSVSSMVQSLTNWSEGNVARADLEQARDMKFWLCLFALNQHNLRHEVGNSSASGPFNAAISQAKLGAVLIIGKDAEAFDRLWCLYEVYSVSEANKELELICEYGSLRSLPAEHADLVKQVGLKLQDVSAATAQVSSKADHEQIVSCIVDADLQRHEATLIIEYFLLPANFTRFDRSIRRSLSGPLLASSVANRDREDAFRWALFGASYSKAELQFFNPSAVELGKLLELACQHNYTAELQLLLEAGVSIQAADADGCTPLMIAAKSGHEDVAAMLLDNSAAAHVASLDGCTALMHAAHYGHEGVVKVLLGEGAVIRAEDSEVRNLAAWILRNIASKVAHMHAVTPDGRSALILAAQAGHTSVAALLLEKGANICATSSDCRTALMHAAHCGHLHVADLLLDKGADVLTTDSDGWTALTYAAHNGHSDVVALLSDRGANIHAGSRDGWTALMFAVQGGHAEVVRLFLDRGVNSDAATPDGRTALMLAAQAGHTDVAALLLDRNASINASSSESRTALMHSAHVGHTDVTALLLDKGADIHAAAAEGWTALLEAAQNGHRAIIVLLLNNGANIHDKCFGGWSALMFAAQDGHQDVAALLMDKSADIHAASSDGRTALILAAQAGFKHVTALLLDRAANIHASNAEGRTALMHAAHNGHKEVTSLLLDRGANIHDAAHEGGTALIEVAYSGHRAVVALLLDNNANIHAQCPGGWTALMFAARNGHKDVATLLLDKDANIHAETSDRCTALMLAENDGHTEMVDLLWKRRGGILASSSGTASSSSLTSSGDSWAI